MTYPSAALVRTRVFDRLEQALNSASIAELTAFLDGLRGGMRLGDLLQAQWQAGNAFTLSRSDQNHLMNHVFGRKSRGWWGRDVEAIAGEGLAQVLSRMLFDLDGQPRRSAKRVACYWFLPGALHFYNTITESDQQITYTWVTPPKGDQPAAYAWYREQVELADKTKVSRESLPPVPDNLTRKENIWIVSATRFANTRGVDSKGKPRALAEIERRLTRGADVTVARPLCEDYRDRYPQGGRARRG
jgi:hypothetical protein